MSPRSWFRRSVPVPGEVVRAARAAGHPHLLAGAPRTDGGWLVASRRALVLMDRPAGGADGGFAVAWQVPWHEVCEVTWTPDSHELRLRLARDGARPALELDGSGEFVVHLAGGDTLLPEVVRERMMSTYVLSDRVPVRGRHGVAVAVRRDADSGQLFVQSVPDPGVGRLTAETTARVHERGAVLGAQAGIRVPTRTDGEDRPR